MRDRRAGWRAGAALAPAWALAGCADGSGPGWAGTFALLLALAAGIGLGFLGARQQARRELHAARQQARLLSELAGGRLWRAQGGAARFESGATLDEVYDAGRQSAAVAAGLARPEPFGPLLLPRRDGEAAEELQALPWYDDAGAWGGLLGVARPMNAHGLHGQALQALCEAWPGLLAVLMRQDADAPWQLLQASGEAQRLLGDTRSLETDALASTLPATLHEGLRAPGAWAHEGWHLVHQAAGGVALLLVWHDGGAASDDVATLQYTLSHDLCAPIRVVEGFTRIVKEDYGTALDRVANDHLDRVLGATARMNQMIDAMLALARLGSQPMARQPVNLSQLAGYVIDELRRASPERDAVVEIETDLQCVGDPTLLRMVLENLLGNAWKYSAKRAQTRIVFGRETVDGRACYVVRDNGAGFDMRSADRLFGLFQRLHSASDFQGTGIGLASVRRIVQRHGGTVWADGEPGRGAAFYFSLRG